jgi:hypothetical protein
MNARPATNPSREYFAADRATATTAMRSLTRACVATAVGAQSSTIYAADFIRQRWPSDRDALALVQRAAVSPTTIATGAYVSPISAALLPALVPLSAAADLLSRALRLDFDGSSVIALPELTAPAAGFVTQGAPIPVVAGVSSGAVTLVPRKFAVITTLTAEMLRDPNVEALVRTVLVEAMGAQLDTVLFDDTAADSTRPAGLLENIAATPANAGSGTEAMIADVSSLIGSVAGVGGKGIVLIAATPQWIALSLRSPKELRWPVLPSNTLTSGTVIAVATSALVSAFSPVPTIEASKESVLHMETDTVAQIVGSGGTATPVRSLFQTDTIGLKLRLPCAWALRSASGLAWTESVNW